MLATCGLDNNRGLARQHGRAQACDAGVKGSCKFISCTSARTFAVLVCGRNTYGTSRYTRLFCCYLASHLLSSLVLQHDPFSSPIQR